MWREIPPHLWGGRGGQNKEKTMFILKPKKQIIFVILLLFSCFLHSQMIVKIEKGSPQRMNLLENLNLNLCLEMENFIVVSLDSDKRLLDNNIEFEVLTEDNQTQPLVIIKNNKRATSNEAFNAVSYIGEIVLDEPNLRIERLYSSDQEIPFDLGVMILPIRVYNRPFRNIKTVVPDDYLSRFSLSDKEIIINSINADSLAWFVQKLEDFETRFAFAENRFEVSQWIADQFTRMGYTNVVQDPFTSTAWGITADQKNVIAVLEGSVFPDDYIIIGAHHDSVVTTGGYPYVDPSMIFAPGADDNASGTAAVLEIARVFKEQNIQPLNSIRFMTFAMEEQWMHGSYHDVRKIMEEGMNVTAMFNLDMIGNQPFDLSWVFWVIVNEIGDFLMDLALPTGENMDMEIVPTISNTAITSDALPYHSAGIPIIYFFEHYFSPHYHQVTDLLTNLNIPYMTQFTKLIISILLDASNMPANPTNFVLYDMGDGETIVAEWDKSEKYTFDYKLLVKNTENNEVFDYETSQNSIVISGLTDGILYEIILFAIFEGNESFGIKRYIEPLSSPRAVSDFTHLPLLRKIDFNWSHNQELLLSGYKIYRRETNNDDFIEIATLSKDINSWSDSSTIDRQWHEYTIKAFNENGNLGPDSNIITTRHLSFNDGITIADYTMNSENSLLQPPKTLVDEFYRNLILGYEYEEIESLDTNHIKIEDIGAYSTLLIHQNSFIQNQNAELRQLIHTYIDWGGNIIYSANDPMRFLNMVWIYPMSYEINDFPREYFKIEAVHNPLNTRFSSGISTGWNGLPNLEIDTSKIPVGQNGKINRVEGFISDGFQTLYTYFSDSDSPTESALDGYPVALYTTKGKSQIVITSIPLYFIKQDQAKEFMTIILNYMKENVYEDDFTIPAYRGLNLTNYPNPFNPFTTIEFSLPVDDFIEFSIYNIRGQLIKSFSKDKYSSGRNSILWDGTDGYGNPQSSGIYFYQIKSDRGIQGTGRMVLLK